jgi:hypothetical protein
MNRTRRRSDYENAGGDRGRMQLTPGPNDTAMAPQSNTVSDGISGAVDWSLEQIGYDGSRRTGTDDNDFYRDNAQYMPGWGDFGLGSASSIPVGSRPARGRRIAPRTTSARARARTARGTASAAASSSASRR